MFLIYLSVICVGMFKTYYYDSAESVSLPVNRLNIVIDAGHGGFDPGKVANGIDEKVINLQIAHKLQLYLEQGGSYVLNTRTEDNSLSEGKRGDLKERINIANSDDVDMMISIHQNSFPSESVRGAQVFYYKSSQESKLLAQAIQKRIRNADKTNKREAKASGDYYILKKSNVPAVIVECGFLSNDEEKENLQNEKYQERIAWAIYLGINDFLSDKETMIKSKEKINLASA
ncbi:MAG: N-acetylmuramoyl-L-alanine amidase [Firmicutes bacterium]|nr:N-acetylmuramoyl-L-alanine amidase [Bacillota bacterium]